MEAAALPTSCLHSYTLQSSLYIAATVRPLKLESSCVHLCLKIFGDLPVNVKVLGGAHKALCDLDSITSKIFSFICSSPTPVISFIFLNTSNPFQQEVFKHPGDLHPNFVQVSAWILLLGLPWPKFTLCSLFSIHCLFCHWICFRPCMQYHVTSYTCMYVFFCLPNFTIISM